MSTPTLFLLRLHIEAGWYLSLPPLFPGDIELPADGTQPPWLLHASAVAQGVYVRCWRADVPDSARQELAARAEAALALPATTPAEPGLSREVILSRAAEPTMHLDVARATARPLTAADRALVEAFEADSAAYYLDVPATQPVFGVVVAGQLASIAHSSRRTESACELGIDTAPEARGRGYALAATLRWAEAVTAEGLVPLYSARADNVASLALAQSAGYRPVARAAYIGGGTPAGL
jgi:hypothetical protein